MIYYTIKIEEKKKEEIVWEKIITTNQVVLKGLQNRHNVHLLKKPGRAWSVVHNSLGSDVIIDGVFESTDLCKQWTYEELEEFGKI